jgi:hypothetical protein
MTTSAARDVTVRVSHGGRPPVQKGSEPGAVVSVLFGEGLEAWRRGWSDPDNGTPEREAVVVGSDISRGTATATPARVLPDRGLAYTVLGQAPDVDRLSEAVSDTLGRFDAEPRVIVDDLAPLVVKRGASAAAGAIAAITTAADGRVVVGCSLTPDSVSVLPRVVEFVDGIEGVDPAVATAVARVQREDPTTFGYTRRYWTEAQRGIESCTRNYPQSKQVHAALTGPETTPRTLGATLSGLVSLGVLETWGETVGPTRYDLTAYDPDRLAVVGAALTAASSDGESDRPVEE